MHTWKWGILCLLSLVPFHTSHGLQCTQIPESGGNRIVCEPTLEQTCTSLGYKKTSFPNIFNHSSQAQAREFFGTLDIDYSCSQYLIHFLCSTAFPLCAQGLFQRVGPCREMCDAVRESCPSVIDHLNINCNMFHRFGTGKALCIWNSSDCNVGTETVPGVSLDGTSSNGGGRRNGNTNCTGRLTPLANNSPRRDASFAGIAHCVEPCQGVYFDDGQQSLIVIWITAWSLITLFVSAVVSLTYVLNFKNVPSLEAPIYYISLCCVVSALCYTLSVAVGSTTLICDSQFTNQKNESAIVVDSLSRPLCLSIFGLLYYSTVCMWSWWAVLCVQWLLSSLRFANVSNGWKACFHLIAWDLPLPFMVVAMSLNHVSGDPIMHTCWIDKQKELPYLIAPLSLCLLLCSIIVIVTFARVVKLQKLPKSKRRKRTVQRISHSTLVRVGLYCTVFMLPMGVLLCVYFYEYWFREQWELDYLHCSVLRLSDCPKRTVPLLPLFLAKIAASLLMGILSFFWIIKNSTAATWRKVFCFCLATGDSNPRQSYTPNTPSSSQPEQYQGTGTIDSQKGHESPTTHRPPTFNSESSV